MNSLDELIEFCEDTAKMKKETAAWCSKYLQTPEYIESATKPYEESASRYYMIADCLKTLRMIWNSGDCNDCGNRGCLYKPKLGHLVRYNCPFYRKEVKADELN